MSQVFPCENREFLEQNILSLLLSVCVLAAASLWLLHLLRNKKNTLPLPPYGPHSIITNVRSFADHHGTAALDNFEMQARDVGPIYRLKLPTLNYNIVVTDHNLARLCLVGAQEGEKGKVMEVFNFLGPMHFNLVTHKTADPSRERARKGLAPAFSSINLRKAMPSMYEKIGNVFQQFDHIAESGEIVDVQGMMKNFSLQMFACTSLGMDVTFEGEADYQTQRKMVIDGSLLTEATISVQKESSRQLLNPIRKWLFWNRELRQANAHRSVIKDMLMKMVSTYRANHSTEEEEETNPDTSIMGHLMRHRYRSDIDRISDLYAFIIAGHETTAFSLGFLMLELARHPDVLQKLLLEIDAIFPSSVFSPADGSNSEMQSRVMSMEYLECCIRER